MAVIVARIFSLLAIVATVLGIYFPEIIGKLSSWVVPLLGIIMFGMGATLSIDDFKRAFKKPKAVLLGLILQFTLMPLLAFTIGTVFDLPKELFIGLVLVGSVAGGTASNVIAYLAGGDVALSITMTACSTMAGIVLTPILAKIYLAQTVDVSSWAMFKQILLIVALPVVCGIITNKIFSRYKKVLDTGALLTSIIGILMVIAIVVALNAASLKDIGAKTLIVVIMHNTLGLLMGYFISRLLKFDRKTSVTVAIETGMQNSGLAVALAKSFFGISATLPGAIFSIWHNLSGAIFAGIIRPYIVKDQAK